MDLGRSQNGANKGKQKQNNDPELLSETHVQWN